MKYITKSFKQTQKLGEKQALRLCSGQAKDILTKPLLVSSRRDGVGARKSALVLGLQGNLGGGKTTFLQGFAKGLGIKEKILSPTFVIIKRFKIKNTHFKNFYHIDCYRINNIKDIGDLGLLDIISNPENIVAVEWPERIKKNLPKSTIIIKFNFIDKNKREIVI